MAAAAAAETSSTRLQGKQGQFELGSPILEIAFNQTSVGMSSGDIMMMTCLLHVHTRCLAPGMKPATGARPISCSALCQGPAVAFCKHHIGESTHSSTTHLPRLLLIPL